jgi:hypothetical protein
MRQADHLHGVRGIQGVPPLFGIGVKYMCIRFFLKEMEKMCMTCFIDLFNKYQTSKYPKPPCNT